jgi:hypothetical protein
LENEKMKL